MRMWWSYEETLRIINYVMRIWRFSQIRKASSEASLRNEEKGNRGKRNPI